MDSEKKEVRIVKANRLLQAKVGIGPVDEKKIAKSQKLIDNHGVDFLPLAEVYIAELEQALEELAKDSSNQEEAIAKLTGPVMQLKANAAMFGYDLVGSMSNIMLNFLETIEKIDRDVLEIAKANHKTLQLILNNDMKGDGGPFGKELTTELKEACKRYFAKKASAGDDIDDKDAFFIDG
ncbi:MAG: hypothetical protein H6867_02660 [Rhodospirillales bacterium]|nr:hypothetical protein [Rhodospirillales bacterium]MCB9997090.1 hypothetical protein [Rhodospirillales bacterium]